MTPVPERLASLLEHIAAPPICRRGDNGPAPAPVSDGLILIADITGYIVYRLFDAQGDLLYIGQTQDLTHRVGFHLRDPRFGTLIHCIRYQQVTTYREMCELEASLIRALQPPHNTVGLAIPPPSRDKILKPGFTDALARISHSHQQAVAKLQQQADTERAEGLGIHRAELALSYQEGGK